MYRARCFVDEAESAAFRSQTDWMTLEEVMSTFRADLARNGVVKEEEKIAPMDLALLILDNYARYPLPHNAVLPYNYCMLPQIAPWTAPLMSWIC